MSDFPAITVTYPDPRNWDRFCDGHDDGHLLQLSRWGQLKHGTAWHTTAIGICDDGTMLAGAQILTKKQYGLAVCYVPRGPLLCDDPLLNHALIAAITQYAKRQRAVLVRYEPNILTNSTIAGTYQKALAPAITSPSTQPQHSIHTAIDAPDAALLAQMTKGHRADIKKAERLGVTIRTGHDDVAMAQFVALMQATGARAHFAVHSAQYYTAAWQLFGSLGRATLLLADYQGQTVAAALILANATTACYLYGGSAAEAFFCGANHLIQWYAMRWARDLGCQIYDLWGIPYPSDDAPPDGNDAPMAGLIRFKKGFGGTEVTFLPAYTHVLNPLIYRVIKNRLPI
jgi:lipid II:glycine glycyltransferase (peptidoglycan interpeptide bridge formation enzyme)